MRHLRPAAAVVVSAVALLAFASGASAGDFIQRKDGSFQPAIKGETPEAAEYEASTWQVLDANIDEISYTILVNGKPTAQRFKSAEAIEIWLEAKDYSPLWREATNFEASGDHLHAAQTFVKIAQNKTVHPVARQKAYLNAGRSLAAIGDAKNISAADATWDALLKEFPTTFYSRAVGGERWRMWMDAGNEDKANAAIDWLLKLPGVTDSDKLEARVAKNTISLRKAVAAKDQNAIQKCLDEFKAIASETAVNKQLAAANAAANIGQGTCLLELGKTPEARTIFADISEQKGAADPVLAAAFNGLGDCWYRQNDVKGYVEARRCYLRTSCLYTEGTPADVVAKALYFAGECFSRVQDNGDTWKDRARNELRSCISRYPNSPWADKAKKLLPTIPK